jgi:leucyl/phenylalanyl-tRNA--protein transferase
MSFPNPATHRFPEWVRCGEYIYYGRDVVSFGDELTAANLREAYLNGIFPWYMEGVPLPWYCPERRAVLDFDELHVPQSLRRARNKQLYTFTIDRDFRRVMEECSLAERPGQGGTWIVPEFIEAYTELHEQGMAHSVEAWDADGVFCGESMFFKRANASKLALLFLIGYLASRGATWLDCQVMTPHMKALGAKEIGRTEFLDKLNETQRGNLELF